MGLAYYPDVLGLEDGDAFLGILGDEHLKG